MRLLVLLFLIFLRAIVPTGGFAADIKRIGIESDLSSNYKDINLIELPRADRCCGFGGTFSVKNPEISEVIEAVVELLRRRLLAFERLAFVAQEVVSVDSLTALTDLESLADGRKRLKGYSQEELLQEATAFSGKRYFRSENRTAMLYMD